MDNGTSDIGFAAWLQTNGYKVTRITGDRGRKFFVFDKQIPPDLLLSFNDSPERQLLENLRALKVLAMHHV